MKKKGSHLMPVQYLCFLFDLIFNMLHFILKTVFFRTLFFLLPLQAKKVVIRVPKNESLKDALFLIKLLLKNDVKVVCLISKKGKFDFLPKNICFAQKNSISSLFHIYTAQTIIYYGIPKKLSFHKSFQRNILIFSDIDIKKNENCSHLGYNKIDICICSTGKQYFFAKNNFINIPIFLRSNDIDVYKIIKTIVHLNNNQFVFFLKMKTSNQQFIRHYISLNIQSIFYILNNGSLFKILYLKFFKIFDSFLTAISKMLISKCSFLFSVDEKKIVLYNNFNQFSCNIKYIAKELLNQTDNYKLVYIISNAKSEIHSLKNIKIVKTSSLRAVYELATAKIWIYNSIKKPFEPIKKRNQIFIQTWHGSLGIKRVDPEYIYDKKWLEKALKNTEITDYCISNSAFETAMYRNSYWKNSIILEYGHARNDILFRKNAKLVEKIRKKFNVPEGYSICMYAPTYREDYDFSMYLTEFDDIIAALENNFKKKFVIFVRFHHWLLKRAKAVLKTFIFTDTVINVSDHEDMQELLAITDIGISDYSSWVFDFMLTHKPVFLYASDAEDYQLQRSFYYKLTDTPFPVSSSVNDLIESIIHFDNDQYKKNVNSFLLDKGCIDDGYASIRIVNKILELLQKDVHKVS